LSFDFNEQKEQKQTTEFLTKNRLEINQSCHNVTSTACPEIKVHRTWLRTADALKYLNAKASMTI